MLPSRAARRPVIARRRAALPALLLSAGLVLSACGGSSTTEGDDAHSSGGGHDHAAQAPAVVQGPEDTYAGFDLAEPYRRPTFSLTDTTGAPFDFRTQTAGKPTLLFFGYTNCPDVCPTTMADVAVALRTVDPEIAEQVQVVFVSTDPAVDTPEVLGEYLGRFDGDLPNRFIGLTGSQEDVVTAQLAAGVPQAEDDGRMHSTLLLLYGTDDEARVAFDTANDFRDIASDLELVVGS
ncbi:SCO family protein [Blastococcus sp. CCUG 61487]|uniref:SCO family protein n=1 Tax=Blastococcus sp. CCUG 61487 TaxID=1840703 RepID=UPI0010C0967A|nr:SCO family protein [Blastococcus sp. CCUG 61487]TKJ35178.1 electron transporter SenC [Blastococcus sp. CCUG 61487]